MIVFEHKLWELLKSEEDGKITCGTWKRICNLVAEHFANERTKAFEECKSVILQTIDNEMLVDTLFLRIDELKEKK